VVSGAPGTTRPIKLLAILEASTVTGVARNILDFCEGVRDLNERLTGSLPIETSLVTFNRTRAAAAPPPTDEMRRLEGSHLESVTDEPPNEFVKSARELGIHVDVIAERFRFDLRVIPALRRIVNERAPDILATHNLKSHFLVRLSGLNRSYPWIAFHHGYTTTDLKMRVYNQLNRWSLPAADRVVTVCQAFARELAREGVPHERISAQHNSISPEQGASAEEVADLRRRLGIKDGERLVLAIGRLSREKAHLDLVNAFARLRHDYTEINAKLLIVGDGPERGAVEAAIRTLGIDELAILTGHISDVRPYYAAADVFVLPSHSEGSPYVLLETMRAGVPLVATSVGGVPEMVVDNETALLVSPRDAQALAAAIARILMDEQLAHRLASNATALVATRYSPETYVRSLFEIYRSLVPGRAAANAQVI
jgi:glycosyltransferase involved in cell wall biosynthesis